MMGGGTTGRAGVDGTADKKRLWLEALSNPGVWKRACQLGLSVGLLQAVIPRDIWLEHAVSPLVVVKTVLTPLVTLTVALISAAATYVEKQRHRDEQEQI